MSEAALRPPRLPRWRWRPLLPGEIDHEALWLTVSAGSALLGFCWLRSGLPLPGCLLKAATGCPCPACGATRAALRLLQGDLPGAFRYNPLAVLAGTGFGLYDLYAGAVLTLRRPRLRTVSLPPAIGLAVRVATISAVAMNWAWVIGRGN